MRRLWVVLLSAMFVGPALRGQTPQAPVFRGGVTLIPVDVTVLDRDGKPVPGLAAEDFEVKLDGHQQPVRTVAYDEIPLRTASSPTDSAPRREVTNARPAAEPRLFVLLVDDLVVPAARDKGLFLAASRFVEELPTTDVVGFTTSSGSAGVNPTLNRAAVEAGLRRTAGWFVDPRDLPPDVAVGLDEAAEIYAGDQAMLNQVIMRDCGVQAAGKLAGTCPEQVELKVRRMAPVVKETGDRQLSSYLAVINAMRAVPGRKFLVILTDGLLVPQRGGHQIDLAPLAPAAAATGVQLNVLFADPDAGSVTDRSAAQAQTKRDDGLAMFQGIQTVADLTGGNFFRVMGQPDRFFTFLGQATSAVYHLGVEAPSGTTPGRNVTVAARVTRPGLTVHANRVALLPAPAVVVPVDDQLQTAVIKGQPNYGVPVALATVLRRASQGDGLDLGANIEIPASTPGPLTAEFGLLDANGKVETGRKSIEIPPDGGDYRVSLSLPVARGQYRLRFAVADAAGHVGSIDTLVSAELKQVGPFLVSDVMSAWSGVGGKPQFLALEEVPASASELATFLELYPAPNSSAAANVRVQWTLVGNSVQPIADETVVPQQANNRLTATERFPLTTLPAGSYEVQATISVDGRPVGTVSTSIRKADKAGSRVSASASGLMRR